MIKITQQGNFNKITNWLQRIKRLNYTSILDKYGKRGVHELSLATPKDTGLASNSWSYKTYIGSDSAKLSFYNSDIEGDLPVVILIQYGHATKNGSWVEGKDFINPAIGGVLNDLADELWREATKT
jgi:hypothetical protein